VVAARQELVGVPLRHDRLQVEHGGAVQVPGQLVDGGGVGAELGRHLGRGRAPAQPQGQVVARPQHAPGLGAHRAARPVRAAQLVEQGATDAGGGVVLEAGPAARVPAPGRQREPEHGGRQQVVTVDVAGQAASQLVDRLVGQWQVRANEVGLDRATVGCHASNLGHPPWLPHRPIGRSCPRPAG
jgi:hypothetical protein